MTIRNSTALTKLFFHLGFFLISVIAITLMVSSVCFFTNGTIGWWQFPISILIALVLNNYLYTADGDNTSKEKPGILLGLSLLMIIFSVAFSSCFYDISFDGQAYHQEALIQLKNGWNPYWQVLPKSVNQVLWVNHYAKGMETVQAAIYCTFDLIEAGKATNIILWLGSFFITLSFICNSRWLSFRKAVLISFLLASNPIVINQLITFYVDGPLASLLLCLLVLCVFIIKKPEPHYLLLLSAVIILLINVKFTALLCLVLFIGGSLIWSVFKKRKDVYKKLWWTAVSAGVIAVIAGFNPYVTNTINFNHPFYPLMGKNKADIMTINLPRGFEGKSGAARFLISTFSHTDNVYPWSIQQAALKIPFAVNKIDVVSAPKVDARLGGFGPMFSGILLLSIVLLFMLWLKESSRQFFKGMILLSILIILSVILMPESWWARYVPQLWFLPLIWLLTAEVLSVNRHMYLKYILYVALLINITFSLTGIVINLILSDKINYQLALLKSSSQPVVINWRASESNRIRFLKHGIPYKVQAIKGRYGIDFDIMAGSQAQFIWPKDVDPKIKKSALLRLTENWIPVTWLNY